MNDTESAGSEQPVTVYREMSSVKLEIEWVGKDKDVAYLPPEFAVQLATWLQQAAADCKRYQQASNRLSNQE